MGVRLCVRVSAFPTATPVPVSHRSEEMSIRHFGQTVEQERRANDLGVVALPLQGRSAWPRCQWSRALLPAPRPRLARLPPPKIAPKRRPQWRSRRWRRARAGSRRLGRLAEARRLHNGENESRGTTVSRSSTSNMSTAPSKLVRVTQPSLPTGTWGDGQGYASHGRIVSSSSGQHAQLRPGHPEDSRRH
jgi:hypothetical protein